MRRRSELMFQVTRRIAAPYGYAAVKIGGGPIMVPMVQGRSKAPVVAGEADLQHVICGRIHRPQITIPPIGEQFAGHLHCLLVNPAQACLQNRDAPVRADDDEALAAHQTGAAAYGQITEDPIMHQPKTAARRRARAIALAAATPATAPLELLSALAALALASAFLLRLF